MYLSDSFCSDAQELSSLDLQEWCAGRFKMADKLRQKGLGYFRMPPCKLREEAEGNVQVPPLEEMRQDLIACRAGSPSVAFCRNFRQA